MNIICQIPPRIENEKVVDNHCQYGKVRKDRIIHLFKKYDLSKLIKTESRIIQKVILNSLFFAQ